MYTSYFGLREAPFSITPNPRYLYMSPHHREALAHLLYGIGQGGGFVQLTGEVGTGKTTLCRYLLEQMPEHVDVALILNPTLTSLELLQTICDELEIPYATDGTSLKVLVDTLNAHLLRTHAEGRRTVLIIDEAQHLYPEVLEQIRLLTNLETATEKLLQIILIGQPELVQLLRRPDLRQLAQRVTARYHLRPLSRAETRAYIGHRMAVGGQHGALFTARAAREIQRLSGGIPRLINVICDRALLGAYAQDRSRVDAGTVRRAAREVLGPSPQRGYRYRAAWAASILALAAVTLGAAALHEAWLPGLRAQRVQRADSTSSVPAAQTPASSSGTPLATASVSPAAARRPPADPIPALPAAAGTVAAGPDLARLLLDAAPEAQELMFFNLFARWGLDYRSLPGGVFCERAERGGLRCLGRNGSWDSLRGYNLPALIELIRPDGEQRLALVSALDQDTVTLDFGTQHHAWPIEQVDAYWRGDYLLLWRPPPLASRVIAPGAQGPDVAWLRQQLDRLDGGDGSPPDGVFDLALRQRVLAFQRSRALQPDGIVGEQTLIHLLAALGDPTVPMLSQLDR